MAPIGVMPTGFHKSRAPLAGRSIYMYPYGRLKGTRPMRRDQQAGLFCEEVFLRATR